MNKINFYRLDYATLTELDAWMRERSLLSSATDLKMKLRVGDYLLAARYDPHTKTGQVRAIGRVMRSDAILDIEWRADRVDLHPNQQGHRFWQKAHFRFADSVAERYMLKTICTKLFADVVADCPWPVTIGRKAVIRSASSQVRESPGFVYVIQSPYGYKIGKSRRLHERARLFSVKLPFPIEVLMTGWFSNYSEAERRLHQLFHGKRLDGEWFALDSQDLIILQKELAVNIGAKGGAIN